METKNLGGGDNLNTFTVNPAFLLQDPKDIFSGDDYRKLSFEELIEHNLKKDRRIRRLKSRIAKLTELNAIYKEEKQLCQAKNHRQKQDCDYQQRTVELYRRILELLTKKEG